ncbi:MAG: DUF3048 domain-containing protein [Clostridia bacterium]|nr:DUF3048 domain-containing protein [Clostridia bacterium]
MKKMISVILLLSMLAAAAVGCNVQENVPGDETTSTEAATEAATEPASETETEPESETETEPETEFETEPPLPDEAEKVENPQYSTNASANNTGSAETEAASEEETEPERVYNYLNGVTTTEEEQNKRPIAIMMNNIHHCLPQANLLAGDMYYECAAEGGITRIMMLVSDYENMSEVGSVRSSRDYFVDFLANHNALYVHAGGSPDAYSKIEWRGINNLDGVNMYLPNEAFYRDMDRWTNMGMEHSLMTTGAKIAAAIEYKGYPTTHDETFENPFKFYDENTDNHINGSPATHVRMESTSVQTVDFVYDTETGEYWRYQYNGEKQVDALTGEQLSVKNVIILFTEISLIPGDEAGRLSVATVGSGQGYYITNGKRKVINWSREGKTTPIHLEYRNGDELILNSGKTFICVVDDSVAQKIDFEYEW